MTGGAYGCAQCGGTASCGTGIGTEIYGTIWQWLNQLNTAQFAGHSDWRLPTATELESIVTPMYPNCTSPPCIFPAFNTTCTPGCNVTDCSCTASSVYWSATTSGSQFTLALSFNDGDKGYLNKDQNLYVRAVRDGS